MVAAQDEEVFGIPDLVGEEKADGLQRLFASVDVVSQEQVIGFRRESTIFKQTEEIVILTMDIATNLDTSYVHVSAVVRLTTLANRSGILAANIP